MNKTNKIIGLVLVVMILAVVVVMILKLQQIKQAESNPFKPFQQIQEVNLEKMKTEYRQQIGQILYNYILAESEMNDDEWQKKQAQTKDALDDILDLRLNSEDKEFHLDLVLILSQLEQGYAGAVEDEVSVAQSRLEDLLEKTEWIQM